MLYFKDVPVVIEPGVGALEVGIVNCTKQNERLFYVPFERVDLNKSTAVKLPFVVSSSVPHVFTMDKNLDKSPFLLLYDYLGKLSTVYSRDEKTNVWVKNDAAPEQVGDTITQFSVRLSFNSVSSRDKFLTLLYDISKKYKKDNRISRNSVAKMLDALEESKVPGAVVLPVAVAKIPDEL